MTLNQRAASQKNEITVHWLKIFRSQKMLKFRIQVVGMTVMALGEIILNNVVVYRTVVSQTGISYVFKKQVISVRGTTK